MKFKIPLILILFTLFVSYAGARNVDEGRVSLNKPSIVGQIVHMDVNNIDLPMKNDGSVGEDGQGYYPNGQTDLSFLFSGGFATTAYVDGQLRASWMAPASLIEEWQPGKWGMDPTAGIAKWYVVDAADGPGSQAYIDWADAVELGADFYDVNGDGIYDPNVDQPDFLGSHVAWTVINDGTPLSQRTPRLGTDPIGLEIHQQVWAFSRADALGDVIFFRYRIINATDESKDDLIFTVWEDPDLGDYQDDLIGNDTTLSLGFIYNFQDDPNYGSNPPAFGVDFFQGPVVESPGDTAYLFKGPFLGIDTLYDMTNLPMTSYMFYIQGDPVIGDPNEAQIARNYQEGGLDRDGNPIDPTDWGTGGTPDTDPRFLFSGDPGNPDAGRPASGWLDSTPDDKRFMVNTGPFQLAAGDTQDVVVAYIVSQASSALGSLVKLKERDETAQIAYDANFSIAGPPPAPRVQARTFDNKIELIIDLDANGTLQYDQTDKLLNRQVFEAIQIYQFQSNNTSDFVGTTPNSRIIARFDLDNQYNAIFVPHPDGRVEKAWDGFQNLNPEGFQDPGSGIIRYVIGTDAFQSNNPLINNKEYYFAVTAYSLNYTFAVPYEVTATADDYIVSGPADWLESSRQAAFISAKPGTAELFPFKGDMAEYSGSRQFHDGGVFFDLVNKSAVTGNNYIVNFLEGGSLWRLTDQTTDEIELDSMTFQADDPNQWNFPIVDGVSVRVTNVEDKLDTAVTVADDPADVWVDGVGGYSSRAVFNNSINFVKFERANLSTFDKKDYFPVKVEFHTSDVAQGYAYFQNFVRARELKDIYIQAFDISNPDQPRQLNVLFEAFPPDFDFDISRTPQIMIMSSDYDTDNRYTGSPDSSFRSEAYLIMQLEPVADTLIQSARFDIEIEPNYPNTELDEFQFSTEAFVGDLTLNERKNLLEEVRVVPNPYWAYSQYERSYDNPQIKFTHLDRIATIRIFNLAGQLIKTIEKNSDLSEVTWDLRNEVGLKVASGMYIAHVEVPEVGEKVIKFAIVQREERLDRF